MGMGIKSQRRDTLTEHTPVLKDTVCSDPFFLIVVPPSLVYAEYRKGAVEE